jgi:hypothetical protein
MADDIFGELPPVYFEIIGIRIFFPAESIRTKAGNRIAKHRRLKRDGAKCEDMGGSEETFEVRGTLSNENAEDPAVLEQGIPLYPDIVNKLRNAFRVHDIGNLMHPREGLKRVRAEQIEIIETCDERDSAAYIATFTEDNEEDVDRTALRPDNGLTGALPEVTETVDLLDRVTVSGDFRETLSQIANILSGPRPEEAVVQYAAQYGYDLYSAGTACAVALEEAHTQPPVTGSTFNGIGGVGETSAPDAGSPTEHATIRRVEQIRERGRQIAEEARRSLPKRRTRTYLASTSLVDVARESKTGFEELLAANPDVDPFDVEAGTKVHVAAQPSSISTL